MPAEGKPYRVGPYCSVPDCGRVAEHAHHIWRRSFTGKAAAWVVLWDGKIVGNLTGLCVKHHDQVTGGIGGHEASIIYDDGLFLWESEERARTRAARPAAPVEHSPRSRLRPVSHGDFGRGECRAGSLPYLWAGAQAEGGARAGGEAAEEELDGLRPRRRARERRRGDRVLLLPIAEKLGRADHRSWRYYTLVETPGLREPAHA